MASPASAEPVTSSVSAATLEDESSPLRSLFWRVVKGTKMILSMVLILFCVVVVSTAICTKQTTATGEHNVHPIVALCIFWFSLAWLAILEGGLNAMVGLQPIAKDLYQDTHAKAYRCTVISHKSDNIERFIVGRQYLDLTIVFVTSFMVSAVDGAQVFGLPEWVNEIFLGSGVAVILCTIVFGQLIAIINCSHNLLDYINNWCMVVSTYLALFVESTGILHAVYLVQIIFTKFAKPQDDVHPTGSTKNKVRNLDDTDPDTNSDSTDPTGEVPSTTVTTTAKPLWQQLLFWARVLLSLGMSIFTVVVFSVALVDGNTTVRSQIPIYVSFLSLVILLFLGGFMEALQIALFRVKHLGVDEIASNERAKRNCDYMFQKNGRGEDSGKLRAFLIGRQIAQTIIMFMIARIINIDMKVEGETLFGVSPQVQVFFFDSGLLNALVCAIFASLSWRVTANFFPIVYLGSPIAIWIFRLCLFIEGTGICESAWIFAKIPDAFVHYQSDEYYISKAKSTAASSSVCLHANNHVDEEQPSEQDLEAERCSAN
jgi:Silicon transporter